MEKDQIVIHVVNLIGEVKETDVKYKKLILDLRTYNLNKLTGSILEEFKIKSKIKLYTFYGREIVDTSDLYFLEEAKENNKIIFIMKITQDINIDYYRLKCFKILDKLGEGGFGKVYLSEQRFTKDKYAIKYLKVKPCKLFYYINST